MITIKIMSKKTTLMADVRTKPKKSYGGMVSPNRNLLPGNSNNMQNRIIIFTRYPAPGTTKTRLIPSLGPVGAADLQRCLTETTYRAAFSFAARNNTTVEICVNGGSEKKMRIWLGTGFEYSRQGE
jgi:hypothetical protein